MMAIPKYGIPYCSKIFVVQVRGNNNNNRRLVTLGSGLGTPNWSAALIHLKTLPRITYHKNLYVSNRHDCPRRKYPCFLQPARLPVSVPQQDPGAAVRLMPAVAAAQDARVRARAALDPFRAGLLCRATSRAMDVRLSLGSLGVLQPAQAFPRGPCGPYEGRKCWRHAARGSRGGWREKHKLEGISPAGSRRLSVMTRRGWNFQKNTPKVKPW